MGRRQSDQDGDVGTVALDLQQPGITEPPEKGCLGVGVLRVDQTPAHGAWFYSSCCEQWRDDTTTYLLRERVCERCTLDAS